MPSHVKTLQQERSAAAWKQIDEIATGRDKTFQKNYGSLVRGLPAMILQNGLAETLAFLDAKASAKAPHFAVVAKQLADGVREPLGMGENQALLGWVLDQPSAEYRRATSEALAYLQWLKRFAEAKDWKSDGE